MYFHKKRGHFCNCGIAPYKHIRGCYCYKWLFFMNYPMSLILRSYQWKLRNLYNIAIERNRKINFLLEILAEYECRQYEDFVNSECPVCKIDLNPFCTYGKATGHKKNCKLRNELVQYEKNQIPIQLFQREK